MIINETKHKDISVKPYFYLSKLCNQEYYAETYLLIFSKELMWYNEHRELIDINFFIPSTKRVFTDIEDCYQHIFNTIKDKKIILKIPTRHTRMNDALGYCYYNYNSESECFITYETNIQEYNKLIPIYVRLIEIKDFLYNINKPYNIVNVQGFKPVPSLFLIKKDNIF